MKKSDENTCFRNEVKDGFMVPALLKRSWYAQINILKYVDKVCRDNNIKYFADCGTLLGSIRHKGFIPWDDDIDLAMMRSDYLRFRDIVLKEENEFINLKCFKNIEGFTDFKILLTNEDRIDFSEERLENFSGFPFATGIDIFPYDYLPKSEEEKEKLYGDIVFALKVKDLFEEEERDEKEKKEALSTLERMLNYQIDRKGNIVHQINLAIEERMSRYSEGESNMITHIPDWVKKRTTEYSKDIFDNAAYMDFENTTVPVSPKYEEQLYVQYGEYIEIVKGFAGHDFPYYLEQITEAVNMGTTRTELHLFEFDENLLERKKYNEKRIIGNKEKYIESINLQSRILSVLIKLIEQGELSDTLDMIQSLQESAIKLGNEVEIGTLNKREEIVKSVERICEYAYEAYQILIQEKEEDISLSLCSIVNELNNTNNLIEDSIFEDKRRIALIFSYAKEWEVLEKVYKEKTKDDDTIVYPILLPYYDYTNTYEKGDMHFDIDELPSNLKVYDYESIDFETELFDEIYYTNAFEKYDWGVITLPAFYANNLQKISPKIVFVQSLIMDDFNKDNVAMMYSAREYVCTPGVVQADEIWAQSEKMKNHFEDILTDVSGEHNRKHWHSIIKTISYEKTANKKKDIKSINQILVYINLSQLTSLKEEKFVQINNIIKDMKGYMIDLCWDRAIEEYMSNYDKETYSMFCDFVRKNSTCGLINTMNSEEIDVAEYAAYAGDRSWLTNIFVSEGKKVYLFDI